MTVMYFNSANKLESNPFSRRCHYGVFNISPEQQNALKNIKPILLCNNKLIQQRQEAMLQNSYQNTPDMIFYKTKDIANRILILLDLEELINFSMVNKCCYLASKADILWENQFQKLFPKLQFISNNKSNYSLDEQSKIYFNEFYCTLNVFKEKYNSYKSELNNLTGLNGTIEEARKWFENCGGEEAIARFRNDYDKVSSDEEREKLWTNHPDLKAQEALQKYNSLQQNLKRIVGSDTYNGDENFISSLSEQGRYISAINTHIPSAFNNQENFEECIKKHEIAKK